MTEATQAQSNTVTLNAAATSTGTELWYAWTWNEGEEGVWIKGSGSNASSVTFTDCRTYIIFVRMDPNGATVPSWDTVWNKTDDLTTQPDKTFTTNGWSGEYMLGSWG